MGYSDIYLENHKCKVCEAIERNVIEPVAVFVPEVEKENLKSELENLNSEQLEDRLKEYYQNIKGKTQTKIPDTNSYTYQTCIFHCEKENEIWMENYNDGYEEYARHRDKAIQEGRPFDENFKIKWNENLVNEFWRRIRAYRFAVDYKEKWDKFKGTEEGKWEQLKQLLPEETQQKIEEDKDLILFNLKDLKIDKIFYDFRNSIFPTFQKYSILSSQDKNKSNIFSVDLDSNFFYSQEKLEFEYKINFKESKFYGKCIFFETNFCKKAYFGESLFYDSADFSVAQFWSDVDFTLVQFFNIVDFSISKYYKECYFFQTKFYGNVIFSIAQFHSKAYFFEIIFYKEVNFRESQFYDNVDFFQNQFHSRTDFREAKFNKRVSFRDICFLDEVEFCIVKFLDKIVFEIFGNNLLFDLSYIQLSEDSEIEIKNLKTCKLVLDNVNNKSKNFFFYDTEIITLEDYQKYAKVVDEEILKEVENSPNLEIENSHLNQMKFINCDFSKAKHIKIESSDLTETKFINTDWGDILEKRICPDLFKENPKKARDVYRQLKLTLDNHKDYFSANGFYALEMKAQEKILEETLGCKKEKDNIFQDLKILGKLLLLKYRKLPKEKHELLVLKIHKLSSDFGQSWTKPLLWIIFSALIFTVIRFLHKKNFPYNILPEQIGKPLDTVATFLNEFAKSLIPIFANKKEVHGLEFVSLLFSIIIGFFVYQFIVAVRRKVKR